MGQTDGAGGAGQQPGAIMAFQCSQSLRDCCWREAHFPARSGKATLFDNAQEQFEIFDQHCALQLFGISELLF